MKTELRSIFSGLTERWEGKVIDLEKAMKLAVTMQDYNNAAKCSNERDAITICLLELERWIREFGGAYDD